MTRTFIIYQNTLVPVQASAGPTNLCIPAFVPFPNKNQMIDFVGGGHFWHEIYGFSI